jgi:hypothetical protein
MIGINVKRHRLGRRVSLECGMANIHLTKRTKRWINAVGAGTWVSGAGWVGMHFLFGAPNEFGLQSSPAEPWWLKVHGAFAFLTLWTGGLLWGMHVVKAWHERRHRWTGSTLFGLLLILIISGYLLYYVGDDHLRAIVSATHWILGLLLPLIYLMHRIAKKVSRRTPRASVSRKN